MPERARAAWSTLADRVERFEAFREHAEDRGIKTVARGAVLVSHVDGWIVVDLHQVHLAAYLLQIHAVEPVTDEPRGAHRGLHHLLRHVIDGQRLHPAGVLPAPDLVIYDLPVSVRHVVAAGPERLAVEDADAPVEVGRHVGLRDDE